MFHMTRTHKRDLWYTLVCIAILIAAFALMALVGNEGAHGETHNVPRFTCGKATGLHDGVNGYRVTKHAHYREFEDGSGGLFCGHERLAIVNVPW